MCLWLWFLIRFNLLFFSHSIFNFQFFTRSVNFFRKYAHFSASYFEMKYKYFSDHEYGPRQRQTEKKEIWRVKIMSSNYLLTVADNNIFFFLIQIVPSAWNIRRFIVTWLKISSCHHYTKLDIFGSINCDFSFCILHI